MGIVAQDVQIPVISQKLEIPVIGRQPSIQDRHYFNATIHQPEPPRCFFTAIAAVAIHFDSTQRVSP